MDVKQRKEILHTNIYLTENDNNSISFKFNLFDGITPIKSFGHHAVIFFKRKNDSYVQGNMVIKKDSYVYTIKGTELSVPGHVFAYIKIYNEDGTERLTLQTFIFEVIADLDSAVYDAIKATPQYEALQEAYALLNQATLLNKLLNGTTYNVKSINPKVNISDVTCFMKCNTVSLTGEVIINNLERPINILQVDSKVAPKKTFKTFVMLNTGASQPKVAYATIDTNGILKVDTFVNAIYSSIILDIRYEV